VDSASPVQIEPSLYAADFAILGAQIEQLLAAGVQTFHFDVGDGRFVEPVTMGPIVLESIAPLIHAGRATIDCHLMVVEPEKHIPQLASAGADSVTFHVEAAHDPSRPMTAARALGLGVGVAFNPETSVARALESAQSADFVLCMSIHPGYSGQPFMPEALDRIKALRDQLPDDVAVQVDGGIDETNAREAVEAGAQLLVCGNAIFHQPDIAVAYERLREGVTT
jgi:ribulose-phosphate 3-epimerase